MGQMVYVLMSLEKSGKIKEWRPVGVVSNPEVANQWCSYGTNVDWVPLALDDVQDSTPDKMPTFHPREESTGEQKIEQLTEQFQATVKRIEKIIDDQSTV